MNTRQISVSDEFITFYENGVGYYTIPSKVLNEFKLLTPIAILMRAWMIKGMSDSAFIETLAKISGMIPL